ncbi:MAG: ester cyclase [Dehalococcoidia bacterium]|nr:ester cyclase [Dehalococcoidia bacterium]
MESKEFMAKMQWALEEAAKGNADALDQVHDPDIVCHLYPFEDIKGLQIEKQSRLAAWQGFSDIHTDWEEMISQDDTIAARYTVHVKHTGENPQFPVPPTGKEVVLRGCFFAHQKNGKTIEVFECDDWLGFMQQLGVIPPAGPK